MGRSKRRIPTSSEKIDGIHIDYRSDEMFPKSYVPPPPGASPGGAVPATIPMRRRLSHKIHGIAFNIQIRLGRYFFSDILSPDPPSFK